MNIEKICQNSKLSSYNLQKLSTEKKNIILRNFSNALKNNKSTILKANDLDLQEARKSNMSESMQDRLMLNDDRINEIAESLIKLSELEDPVGIVDARWMTSEGLEISQIRVPIGVIGIIYESRPNVTVDAASICIKTGNTVILKGGKEAIHTNIALVKIMRESLVENGHSPDFLQLIESTDREATMEFMQMNQYVDVLIPRGSARLIKSVVANATIPVLETGAGNCHIYVDESADQLMAIAIIENAKVQRPSVCNSVEKVLIHKNIADEFLPKLYEKISDRVSFKGCPESKSLIPDIELITDQELYNEFLDFILGVIIIDNTEKAIEHINKYSSSHSESIITKNIDNAELFLNQITSSTVYHNASTRFTDGGKFGYGAEIGISTSKLHARGPMGLKAMTTIKNVVRGSGQIRK
ncbi:MAG: glutamate-5-semialdehyde dehydrogenase [Clostridiales bacterium]|nr:glutamate-5-semialdehyde dehydrogenase [Clostridiales bacterium]